MSRSKHTRPRAILAADRVRRPRERRGAGDRSDARAARRTLKACGIVVSDTERSFETRWQLPRIAFRRPRPGHVHPASRQDVARLLRSLGEQCAYGLRAIELRQRSGPGRSNQLGRLLVPGRIVLYEQPDPPWRLHALRADDEERMTRSGAVVERCDGAVVVHWEPSALREFMLIEVLAHEIGHHLLQHHKGKRAVRVARTRDHEAFADRFVEACRAAWTSRGGVL